MTLERATDMLSHKKGAAILCLQGMCTFANRYVLNIYLNDLLNIAGMKYEVFSMGLCKMVEAMLSLIN